MSKLFYDLDDDGLGFSLFGNCGINSNGDFMIRIGDHMAMDSETRDLHWCIGWTEDEDD